MRVAVHIAIAALLVSGCSTMNDLLDQNKVDYKSASQNRLPPLEIPPDLSRPTGDDRYVVPDVNPSGSATYSAYSKDRAGRPVNSNPDVLPNITTTRSAHDPRSRW